MDELRIRLDRLASTLRVSLQGAKQTFLTRLAAGRSQSVSQRGRLRRRSAWRALLSLLVFTAGFVIALAASAALARALSPRVVGPFPLHFEDAVVVTALLLTPPRRWWPYLVLIGPLLIFYESLVVPFSFARVAIFLVPWVGIGGGAVLTVILVRRFVGAPLRFARIGEVAGFLACVAVAAVPGGFTGQAVSAFSSVFRPWPGWQIPYLGHLLGVAVFTPAIVLWLQDGPRGLELASRQRRIELALLALTTLAVGWLVFAMRQPDADAAHVLVYMLVPVLIWAAVRFGPQGLASALGLATAIAIAGAVFNRGPFVASTASGNVMSLQLFLLFVGVPLFVLAALVRERAEAVVDLRASEARSRAVVRHLPQTAVLLFDGERRHTFADGPGLRALGLTPQELEGRTVGEAFPHDLAAALAPQYDTALAGKAAELDVEREQHSYQIQVAPLPADGEAGPAASAASGARGGRTGMVVLRDVTARRRARTELERERTRSAGLAAQSWEFQTLAEHSPDFIARLDPAGRLRYVNQAVAAEVGLPAERLVGKSFGELGIPQDIAERWDEALRGVVATRLPRTFDAEVRAPDGQVRSLHTRYVPEVTEDGALQSVLGIATDVSALKQAEARLVEQAEELETIFESQADGVGVYDLAGRFVRANRALRDLLGLDADPTYIALPMEQRAQRLPLYDEQGQPVPFEQLPQWRVLRGEILAGASAMEVGARTLDGRDRWLSITGAPMRAADGSGQATGVVLILRDITARRALEQQVAAQAAELKVIFEAMADGVAVYDRDGQVARMNPALRQLLGGAADAEYYSHSLPERAQQLRLSDEAGRPLEADQWPHWRALRGETFAGTGALEVSIQNLDGREVWTSISGAPIHGSDGQIIGSVLVTRDVTDRRALERQVTEQASQLEAIFEAMADGMLVHDTQGRVLRVNQAYRDLVGLEAKPDYLGLSLSERMSQVRIMNAQGEPIAAEQSVNQRALRGEVLSGRQAQDVQIHALDGRDLWLSISGAPIRALDGPVTGAVLIARDVTGRRELERQVAEQASQLEAIFDAQADGVVVYDREGRMVRGNRACQAQFQAFADLSGWSADPSFAALPFSEQMERWQQAAPGRAYALRAVDGHAIPLEQTPTYRALHGETLTGANAVDERFDGPDGRVYVVSVSAAPIRDAAGNITGAVGVSRDVSAQRQLERQVQEQASQLEAIFEGQADGVAVFDLQGRFVRANAALRALLGIQTPEDDYLILPLAERAQRIHVFDETGAPLPAERWPHWRALAGETFAGAGAVEVTIHTLDGRVAQATVTGGPMRAADGQFTGAVLVYHDVTARRALERQAREQASQLEATFEAMTEGVAVLDAQGRVTRANSAARAFSRLTQETYQPHEETELTANARALALDLRDDRGQPIPSAHLPSVRLLRGEVLSGANALTLRAGPRDGRERTVSFTGGPLRDATTGQIVGAVEVLRDVTAHRALERQVAEQASQLEAVFAAMPEMVMVLDAQERIVRVNQAFRALVGLQTDPAYLGLSQSDQRARMQVVDEQGRQIAGERSISHRILRGEVMSGQRAQDVRMRTLDGRDVWVNVSGAPMRAPDGQITGAVLIGRDITARRALERQVAEQERLFRTLVENSPDIIARFDRAERYLYVGTRVEAVTGFSAEQLLGKTDAEGGLLTALNLSAEQHAKWDQALTRAIATSEQVELEFEFTGPTGAYAYLARFIPEQTEDGAVASVLTVTTDVTKLKRAEQALLVATAAAETARQAEARRKRIAESLREALAVVNSTRPPRDVLQYIVDQAQALLGGDATVIYGPDQLTDNLAPGAPAATLRAQAAHGLRIEGRRSYHQRLPFADVAVEQSLTTGQPVALLERSERRGAAGSASVAADGTVSIPHVHGTLPAPYRALLAVPIRVLDGLYGCLLLCSAQPTPFTAEDVALAQAYADQVAQAITTARLQAQRAQAAVEAERTRLAGELHDTVTQEIVSASLLAQSLPALWQTHRAQAEAGLRQLHALTQSAQAGLRALLLELRPGALEHMPLSDALEKLGAAMSMRAGAPIAVDVNGEVDTLTDGEPRIPGSVKVAFYRVAQEALMNAAKHAQARSIQLRLRTLRRGQVELEIGDDGRGFDASAVSPGHFGLAIMQERAQNVGARLRVRSQVGKGATVVMTWRRVRQVATPERAAGAVGGTP
jgi:PAS domain S-box-containing protein